ncbi:methyltransferase domain-containing protein [Candidatus Peregrinibacteria bacterium]|nr:methyltransferase domain-containing protein [Candidatus Peregrinibacteria bacterium]
MMSSVPAADKKSKLLVYTIEECPVCGQKLSKEGKVLSCEKKHSYDIASQGYVNLILANQKRTKDPGDSKAMVESRTHFLGQGYYDRLSDHVNEMILKVMKGSSDRRGGFNVVDVGCGEGYYTERLQRFLEKSDVESRFQCFGVDVSKSAIQKAAKRDPKIQFCVGNSYQLPYLNASVNVIVSIFSPFDSNELMRVLRPEGKIIVVRPGPNHLRELAALLYDKVELQGNPSNLSANLNRQPIDTSELSYPMHLKTQQDIASLVGMTPYFWSLGEEKRAILAEKQELAVTADFRASVFQK